MNNPLENLVKAYTYWKRAKDYARCQKLYAFVLGAYDWNDIQAATLVATQKIDAGLAFQHQMGHAYRPADCAINNIRMAARKLRDGGEENHDFRDIPRLLDLVNIAQEYFG